MRRIFLFLLFPCFACAQPTTYLPVLEESKVSVVPQVSSSLPQCKGDTPKTWDMCFGSYKFQNGNTYTGEWKMGQRDGIGQLRIVSQAFTNENSISSKNPSTYTGQFRDGQLSGKGVWVVDDGRKYEGIFNKNILVQSLVSDVAPKKQQAVLNEQRVALVIGNSSYKSSPLKNPINDARDMANSLRGYGFTVIERTNLTTRQVGQTLREFRSKLTPGSVAVVFYAGHGVQIRGENYLPTVDAEINGEEDVPMQSLSTRQVMDVLGEAKTRMNLVFLDACRDNPYGRSFRSGSRGIAKENAPSGTLISFATRPGSVAGDGHGRNGLYTSVLLEQIKQSNQPIEQVLKRVVSGVKVASRGQQEPWMEGSIEGDFCFGQCGQNNILEVAARPVEELRQVNNNDIVNEFISSVMLGSWGADCSKLKTVNKFDRSSNAILGEQYFNGKNTVKNKIYIDSIRYMQKKDDVHIFEYVIESTLMNTGLQSSGRVIIETDLRSFRRTTFSERLPSGTVLIKDGVVLGNNTQSLTVKRCE